MPVLVLALALMPAAAIVQDPAPNRPYLAGKRGCPAPTLHYAKDKKVLTPRKLGQEPAADQYLTVLRLDEKGCDRPVKVREYRRQGEHQR